MLITKTSSSNTNENLDQIQIQPSMARQQRVRIVRHQKLIKMVHQYTRSLQQQERLQRMRRNTIMQIDIRYRNSIQNKIYTFPRKNAERVLAIDDQEQFDEGIRKSTRYTSYNLHSQNQLVQPSQSQFLQISRGINSLDKVRTNSEKVLKKIGRLQTDLNNQKPLLQLKLTERRRSSTLKSKGFQLKILQQEKPKLNIKSSRTNLSPIKYRSNTQRSKQPFQPVMLPVLGKKVQNLKTDNQLPTRFKIEEFISKKLITQQYQPIKTKGFSQSKVQNYYKKK